MSHLSQQACSLRMLWSCAGTNIPQGRAFNRIAARLRDNAADCADIPIEATLKALKLIMTQNVFTFGDMTFLQRKGTAMGTSPAPQIATICCATEEAHLSSSLPVPALVLLPPLG